MLKLLLASCLLAIVAVIITANHASNDEIDYQALSAVFQSSDQFYRNIFKSIAKKEPKKNLIISTTCLSMSLGMIASGAHGDTLREIKSAMHLPEDDNAVRNGFKNFNEFMLQNIYSTTLTVFYNLMYTKSDLSVKPQFKTVASEIFNSTEQPTYFINPLKSNGFVINRADSHNSEINQRSALMLFGNNMVYNTLWAEAFNPNDTRDLPFHVDSRTVKQVPTMSRIGKYRNGNLANLKASFIELPLQTDHSSVVFIIPNDLDGLQALIEGLSKVKVNEILRQGSRQRVEVFLPRFDFGRFLDLESTLKELGINKVFTDDAELSGIADAKMKLSKAGQTLYMIAKEDGNEPTYATTHRHSSAVPKFHINRGFVYYTILKKPGTAFVKTSHHVSAHKTLSIPIVMGFVYDPTQN